ncbi:N-carbamoylputrescine amidase [Marinivivus vitaminiproducens]|uniref:N-carbamoylputrescine amidase n=1 Tax=Marinivivus vitaminiproducens TaxID=3035935 RepID=UPI0027AA2BC9|nr:N-carbamoylputrescine amidase [Geminicoccaceae bacterium SCSIO 64248]
MREVTVAATQMACSWDLAANVDRAEGLVRRAAGQGAQIVLLQELFETPYFCLEEKPKHFALARPADGHPVIARMQRLARELGVVLPVSYFERAGQAHYNALVLIDADGAVIGHYRKSHIPDGPGYEEKYYFNPGDTGFLVRDTRHGRLGVAICWDQWFPEAARSMALQGAEILFYPTAIGSEPQDDSLDSRDHWQRCMQGHAAANLTPVVASNRIGTEEGEACRLTFYGSSFVTDGTGGLIAQANRTDEAIVTARLDLDALAVQRTAWGVFRDRRPELYGALGTADGRGGIRG